MRRFVEIMWLAVAAITAVEAYMSFSASGFAQRTYVMIGVFFVALFMYSLRKRQRRNYERRKQDRS